MKHDEGWLTNRRPTLQELQLGRPLLEQFLAMFPGAQAVAVGRVSKGLLSEIGHQVTTQVRHPAYGGANAFRSGVVGLLGKPESELLK
jgi:hypothetical protein